MLSRRVAVAGPTPLSALVRIPSAAWGNVGAWPVTFVVVGWRVVKADRVVDLTSSGEFWRIREGRKGR